MNNEKGDNHELQGDSASIRWGIDLASPEVNDYIVTRASDPTVVVENEELTFGDPIDYSAEGPGPMGDGSTASRQDREEGGETGDPVRLRAAQLERLYSSQVERIIGDYIRRAGPSNVSVVEHVRLLRNLATELSFAAAAAETGPPNMEQGSHPSLR